MKKVVIEQPLYDISVPKIVSDFKCGKTDMTLAYKSAGGEGYRVLSKIEVGEKWGWIALDRTALCPCYIGNSMEQAIELATKSRKVYMFDNCSEMIDAMYKKSF